MKKSKVEWLVQSLNFLSSISLSKLTRVLSGNANHSNGELSEPCCSSIEVFEELMEMFRGEERNYHKLNPDTDIEDTLLRFDSSSFFPSLPLPSLFFYFFLHSDLSPYLSIIPASIP